MNNINPKISVIIPVYNTSIYPVFQNKPLPVNDYFFHSSRTATHHLK